MIRIRSLAQSEIVIMSGIASLNSLQAYPKCDLSIEVQEGEPMFKTMPLMSVGKRRVGWWRRSWTILAGLWCACSMLYPAAICDAQTVAGCTAAGGPSDCLFVVQVRQNAAGYLFPTNVLAGQLTEADEANGKNIQLVSPPLVFNYSEGQSQGLISDRVIISGLTATFSSDLALDPLPLGVIPIVVQGESL